MCLEGVAAGRHPFKFFRVDRELQPEFPRKFFAPLLDQAARGHNQNASGVGAQDQFLHIEAGHHGFAGAGVVGQHIAQRLARQH